VLTITEEGAAVLRAAEEAGRRANEALLAPLCPSDRQQLLVLLKRLAGTAA
jgi:DNA-binding MarR family transcriptional regulator